MTDFIKTVTGGFARYAIAWFLPTTIAVGTFLLLVIVPAAPTSSFFEIFAAGSSPTMRVVSGALTFTVVFTFCVLTITVVLAYCSLPIYRLLEGYALPGWLGRPLTRREQRRFVRLQVMQRKWLAGGIVPGFDLDALASYPVQIEDVRPTRLGNALAAMESWGRDRYSLESQTMWYELVGVSSGEVRRNTEETRAPVDFFICAIANCTLLVLACVVALVLGARLLWPVVLMAVCSIVAVCAYKLAVKNVIDWAQAVKAMINLGRHPLALAMGFDLPTKLRDERDMWSAHYHEIELNSADYAGSVDAFRKLQVPRSGTN